MEVEPVKVDVEDAVHHVPILREPDRHGVAGLRGRARGRAMHAVATDRDMNPFGGIARERGLVHVAVASRDEGGGTDRDIFLIKRLRTELEVLHDGRRNAKGLCESLRRSVSRVSHERLEGGKMDRFLP